MRDWGNCRMGVQHVGDWGSAGSSSCGRLGERRELMWQTLGELPKGTVYKSLQVDVLDYFGWVSLRLPG